MSVGLKANVDGTSGAVQVNGNDVVTVNSSGQVGVGTSSPDAKLDVNGYARVSAAAGLAYTFDVFSNGQTTNQVSLGQGQGSATDNVGFLYNRANAAFVFGTNNLERFRITSTGGITSSDLADAVGYKGLPQNAQTSSYTLALSDMGKHISITTGGVVIPANASVAFPIGAAISIFNNSGSNQTISITSDTLRQAGTANTGSRTLAQYGIATCVKVGTTTWVISGAGIS